MVKNLIQSRWVLGLLFLCVTQSQAGIFSEQPKNLVEERSYAGVFGSLCDINRSGDFNGFSMVSPSSSSSTTISQDLSLIPRIKRDIGGGVLVGYRKGAYALEVSYWRSQHIAEWGPTDAVFQSTAVYQSVNLDLKHYFLPRLMAQPFLQVGMGFPWLDVKDASAPYPVVAGGPTGDATFSGMAFNLELGLEVYLNPTFSLFGAVQQRWTGFNQVKGYYRTSENVQLGSNTAANLHADGVNFLVGGTVSFF